MNVEEYEKMHALEDTYWWFQGRMHMIEAIMDEYMESKPQRGRILDLGCGTGLMLNRLEKKKPIGLDFSPHSMKACQERGIHSLIRGDVTNLPIESEQLDLVLALDLIEHVERDDLMVREVHRILRPGGYFMATVPAHQWLWSDHDRSLHHFRRYSYDGFKTLLTDAGFTPVKYSFGITLMYFPVIVFRKLQNLWQSQLQLSNRARPKTHLIPLPSVLNQSLIGMLKLEASLLRRMNLPVGVSLMTLCRKE